MDSQTIHRRSAQNVHDGSRQNRSEGKPRMATTGDAVEREALESMLLRLPADLKEQVRQRATAEERTQAQVIRRALRYYLTQVPA